MSEANPVDARPWRQPKIKDQRYFEDMKIGDRFISPSRTQTDAIFAAFQTASGDNHPIHYDAEFCKNLGFPGLLAHGFQVLVHAAPGAGDFPYVVEEALKAVTEVSAKFKAPVFSGDTIYPMLEVIGLESGRTTGVVILRATIHNHRDELCMEGEIKTLIKRRNPVS